jgi:hypothetical protein
MPEPNFFGFLPSTQAAMERVQFQQEQVRSCGASLQNSTDQGPDAP